MAVTTGVGNDADGRPVVVKQAGPGVDGERLRGQAEILGAAAHPGVEEVVELVDLPGGGVRLTTVFVGGGPLRRVDGIDALLPLVAVTATTLADLHARGVVHGALDAEHILVASEDHTVLCGFAPAGSETGADVAAFGALVAELVGQEHGAEADGLRRIADRASTTPTPTMASVASMLTALLATNHGPARHRPDPPPIAARARAPRRPRISTGTGAVLAAAVVLTAALIVVRGAWSDEQATPSSVPRDGTTTAPRPEPACPAPGARGRTAADVDGDGCIEEVAVVEGVVEAGGSRWQVGAPTDVVTVGDWDCDGTATPALVRPSTGEAWLFDRWPDGAEVGTGRPVPTPPGTVDATGVDPDGDGCPELQAIDTAGQRTPLDLAGLRR